MPKSASTVLIVDDEKDLLSLLKTRISGQGYRVLTADEGEQGLALARRHRPDMILLDVMMPKVDGMAFCQSLRKETQTPILFLTARKNEMDKVLGLKLGGDDYMTKPFSIEELLARIEALLRRKLKPAAELQGPQSIGQLTLDFERHEIQVRGKAIVATPKEFQLLKVLFEADGKVLSREDLAKRLWADEGPVGPRTVDQHVARLRRKLGSERSRIVTVTNAGYRIHAG